MVEIFKSGTELSQDDIYRWLLELRGHSFVPASGYRVASIVKARYGNRSYYFGGVNVENPEYSLSTHGEDGAIAAMVTALGRCAVIEDVWVMGAPDDVSPDSDDPFSALHGQCCGRCRQRIAGFAMPDTLIHSVSLKGDMIEKNMAETLPSSFSFQDYSKDIAADMICDPALEPPDDDTVRVRLTRQADQSESDIFEWLSYLEGVSYASKICQHVVLQLDNGASVAGVRIEDAAFTGINAAQAALSQACALFGSFQVTDIFVYTASRDHDVLPPDAVQPISLAAAQSLYEFSLPEASLTYFSADGQVLETLLDQTACMRFSNPYIMIGER